MDLKNLKEFKKDIQEMMDKDYESFVKAFIVIENGEIEKNRLDEVYDEYMKNDIPLLNPYFFENEINKNKHFEEINMNRFFKNKNTDQIITEQEYNELIESEAKDIYQEYLEEVDKEYLEKIGEEIDTFEDVLNRSYETDTDFIEVDEHGNIVPELDYIEISDDLER